MGCNAALITKRVIDNAYDVLAIQALALAQAIDYLQCHARLSSVTSKFYHEIREISGPIIEDVPQYKNLPRVRKYLTEFGSTIKLV
jgi:histidine ammonia-lyase